jgi:hypothetical protein
MSAVGTNLRQISFVRLRSDMDVILGVRVDRVFAKPKFLFWIIYAFGRVP